MKDILKELDAVFQTISSIPVTHDSVDAMAVARAKLRKVYARLKDMTSEESEDESNE